MAVPKTLTTQIQDLINSIGDLDRPAIKAKLVRFLRLAEALESGSAARKAKAKIARLETALEKADANYEIANTALEQSNAEIGNLQSELQAMQAQIAQYQAGRTKEDEREREMPWEQFDILRRLPSEHGGEGLTMLQVWREVGRGLDETEIHVAKLRKARLIDYHIADGEKFWRRTMLGNEWVVAKRLAGEEEGERQKAKKHPDLPQMEHLVLLAVAHGNCEGEEIEEYIANELPTVGAPITSLGMVGLLLITLQGKKMVSGVPTIGGPSRWTLLRAGTEYLAQRGHL